MHRCNECPGIDKLREHLLKDYTGIKLPKIPPKNKNIFYRKYGLDFEYNRFSLEYYLLDNNNNYKENKCAYIKHTTYAIK